MRRPLQQRIGNAPEELLELLRIDNRMNEFSGRAHPFEDAAAMEIVRRAFAELPGSVHDLIRDRLAGIFVVEDLGSSGYTEYVVDEAEAPVAGIVVLDAGLLEWSGNAWASWRDSTAFLLNTRHQIRNTIARPDQDNAFAAVQFLLIHELGHVASIGNAIHPAWNQRLDKIDLRDYPFTGLSWRIEDGDYRSRFDAEFVLRENLVYYRSPRLSARQLPEVFEQIGKTNFVSLYAATRPEEDFAESFAVYVHSEMMGKPFGIEALVDGRVVAGLGSCFHSNCRGKFELLRDLFAQ